MSDAEGSERVELARSVFDRFNRLDLDGLWALLTPDCVLATDELWPDGGEFRGEAEIAGFVTRFLDAFGDVGFAEDAEPVVFGRRVLLHGGWVGAGATSGIALPSASVSAVITLRDDQVAGMHFFFSDDKAREFARAAPHP